MRDNHTVSTHNEIDHIRIGVVIAFYDLLYLAELDIKRYNALSVGKTLRKSHDDITRIHIYIRVYKNHFTVGLNSLRIPRSCRRIVIRFGVPPEPVMILSVDICIESGSVHNVGIIKNIGLFGEEADYLVMRLTLRNKIVKYVRRTLKRIPGR